MTKILCGENISYFQGDKQIMHNLNFNVQSGNILLILGKNGAGKTTLLRTIAGILEPKSGTIKLDDEDIQENYHQYKQSMAYLGHRNAFNEELTVELNLKFWASLRDTYELVMVAIYYFNLGEVMSVQYSKLSAGWRKRVALARLLISNATIWLLDEPFANLDEEMQELLRELLTTRVQQNGILIMTSHKKIEMENAHTLNLDKA